MDQQDDALARELEELGAKIDTHLKDIQQKGEFSSITEERVRELKVRRKEVSERLATASKDRKVLEQVKLEARRDLASVFSSLEALLGHLDATTMKKRP